MAVSKRLRYEVLRRDSYTCRYCGAAAPDVPLTVDHVLPQALGGSDEPTNLATACGDCNAGKSATGPDELLVADVAGDAARWARAMDEVARRRKADLDEEREELAKFECVWTKYWYEPVSADEPVPPAERIYAPRPDDWEATVLRFHRAGLDHSARSQAVRIAVMERRLPPDAVWRYFCGICWRELDARQRAALDVLREEGGTDGS